MSKPLNESMQKSYYPLSLEQPENQSLLTNLQENLSLSELEVLASPISEDPSKKLDPASDEMNVAHEIRLICLEKLIEAYYSGKHTYSKNGKDVEKEIAIDLKKVQNYEKEAISIRNTLELNPKPSLIQPTDRSLSWLSTIMQHPYDAFPWGNESRLFLIRALRWVNIVLQGISKAYNHRSTQITLKFFSRFYNHPLTQFILTASGLIYWIRITLNLIKVGAATFFPKTEEDKKRGVWKRCKLALLQPDVLAQNLNDLVWGGINLGLMLLTGGFYFFAAPFVTPILQGTLSIVVKAVANLTQFIFDVVFDRHKKKKHVSPFDTATAKLEKLKEDLNTDVIINRALEIKINAVKRGREAENRTRGQQLTASTSILIGMICWFSPSLAEAAKVILPSVASLVIQVVGATFAWFGSIYSGFGRKVVNRFKKSPQNIEPAQRTPSNDVSPLPTTSAPMPIPSQTLSPQSIAASYEVPARDYSKLSQPDSHSPCRSTDERVKQFLTGTPPDESPNRSSSAVSTPDAPDIFQIDPDIFSIDLTSCHAILFKEAQVSQSPLSQKPPALVYPDGSSGQPRRVSMVTAFP